jgi:hypothetical protein
VVLIGLSDHPELILQRAAQVLALLRSRDLYDYTPPTSSGQMIATNTQAEAGEGVPETILCRNCGGEGKKRIRTVERLCPTCRGSCVEVVDQYTGRRLGTELQAAERHQRMVLCDACGATGKGLVVADGRVDRRLPCAVCRGAKVVPGPETKIRPFALEGGESMVGDLVRGLRDPVLRAIVVKGALGSYDELAVGLGRLRVESLAAYDATVALEHDRRPLRAIRYEVAAWFGLLFLERRMPDPIRVPPDVLAIERREAYAARKQEEKQRREEAA